MAISTEIQRLQTAKADIKSAIEEKGVTVPSSTKLDEYADLIDQIQQGGGQVEAPENDVNFYDYDGFRVASYTITEAKALTALPTTPTHEGLTFQEWNWTLADIQSYNRQYIDIGANYITSDGKTHLFINLTGNDVSIVVIGRGGTLSINWGDESTEDTYGYSSSFKNHVFSHSYAQIGRYEVKIGIAQSANDGGYNFSSMSTRNNGNGWSNLQIFEIRFGNYYYGDTNQFLASCMDGWLKVSIPKDTVTSNLDISNSYIKVITIPRNSSIAFQKIQACNVNHICFPKNITSVKDSGYDFYMCFTNRIVLPEYTTPASLPSTFLATAYYAYISIPSCMTFAAAGTNINSSNIRYIDIAQGWTPNVSMTFSASAMWDVSGLVDFFMKLGTTTDAITLTFGSNNLGKLTADQKAIATNKGYTLA